MGKIHLLLGRIRHTAQLHLLAVVVGLDTNRQVERLGVAQPGQEALAAEARQVV
jgi:hypothetical protein